MTREDLHRKIAERAYFYFLQRGGEHGHDLDDWLRAEREIIAETQKESKPKTRRTSSRKSTTRRKTTRKR